MTSQLNNPNENQDQVLQETDTMRPLFFENSLKHTPPPLQDPPQRLRLDSAVDPQQIIVDQSGPPDDGQHMLTSLTPSETTLLTMDHLQIAHTHLILRHHPHLLPQPLLAVPAGQGDSVVLTVMPPTEQVANGAAHFQGSKSRKNSSPRQPHLGKKSVRLQLNHTGVAQAAALKTPKLYRRFRSRSLPIINYTLRSQISQPQPFGRTLGHAQPGGAGMCEGSKQDVSMASSSSSGQAKALASSHHALYRHIPSFSVAPSLPPINLQSLKEIDLQEILKNPQLRHDILFDPQLQFRPNLDGERGRRKKSVIKRYWVEIELECKQFFTNSNATSSHPPKLTRLRALFTTLREILLSLLPMKDRSPVNEIMDIDLIVQQLVYGLFDFVAMAKWLGDVFKSHCAPMRDLWVLDMIAKFQQAFDEACVNKLVEGLRLIFLILEAMKLDVANHQIRILRPVLIETATDFEKDYFQQLITHCKIDILDSLKWFERGYNKRIAAGASAADIGSDMKSVLTTLVIELLLCRNMATEFPLTLAFDHTRLVLLRADVRQLVCVQLCIVLFKQVSMNYAASKGIRPVAFKPELITRVQEQILAIVTDDNGNVKWTRNVQAIALQLVKNAVRGESSNTDGDNDILLAPVPQHLVDFCYNWLIKQIQPNTDVYGLMEEKIFKELFEQVGQMRHGDNATVGGAAGALPGMYAATDGKPGSNVLKQRKADSEMSGILFRISTLVKFHWSVFGDYYTEYVRLQAA